MLGRHSVGGSPSHEERRVVVLDMGTSLTKVGFSGDNYPRHIVRSQIKSRVTGEMLVLSRILGEKRIDVEELERYVCDMLHFIYYKLLLMNPKDRRLCIVESPFQHMAFRNALSQILFNHYGVNLVSFLPSPCACALTVVKTTALVIDVGWEKAVVSPVIQGVVMLQETEVLLTGAKTIQDSLEQSLLDNSMLLFPDNSLLKVSEQPLVLSPDIIEQITIRTCFVSPFQRAKEYSAKREERDKGEDKTAAVDFKFAPSLEFPIQANEILQVTGLSREFSAESLFGFNNDEDSIGSLVASVISKCPIDSRKELLGNIILVGGTCHLPGFKHRLKCEIEHCIKEGPLANRFANNQVIAFHNQPCKSVSTSWLGASIASNSESPTLRYISVKDFRLDPECAADWNVSAFKSEY